MEMERIQAEKKKTPSTSNAVASAASQKPSQMSRVNTQTQDRYNFNPPAAASISNKITEEEVEYSPDERDDRDQDYDQETADDQAAEMGNGLQRNFEGAEEEDYSLKYPKEYHAKTPANTKVVEQIIGHDGKIQRMYANGKKEVIFNNGVKRESFPDGYTIVYFNNQDIKQTFPD